MEPIRLDMHDGINILICMMETIRVNMYDGTNIERAMEPYHVMNLDFMHIHD